jgi:hypothetical protein
MTDRLDESCDGDEAMWQDAVTLEREDTTNAAVHVMVRLDPNVYRAISAEKKAAKDRSIMSTIVRLLSKATKTGNRANVILTPPRGCPGNSSLPMVD